MNLTIESLKAAGAFTGDSLAAEAYTLEFVNDYSAFAFDLVVSADAAASTADGLVFNALYSGVAPGTYNLCYCSDQLDATLEAMGDGETTYVLADDYKQPSNIAAGATTGNPSRFRTFATQPQSKAPTQKVPSCMFSISVFARGNAL